MARLLPAILVVAACAGLFAENREIALVGFDSYPLVASARVRSFGDLAGLATERLMDGRYPSAFYRPLTSASIALDEALYGLDAAGYQATQIAIFGAFALALAALVRRVLGPAANAAACAAVAALLLHASTVEVLPVPARRADTLCGLFMVLTLVAQAGAATKARLLGLAAFSACAVAAKETGMVVPLLVAAFAWIRTASEPGRERAVLRDVGASAAGVALLFIPRLVVLGGLGGHGETSAVGAALGYPRFLLEVSAGSAIPIGWVEGARAVPVGAALLFAAGLALVRTRSVGGAEVGRRRRLGLLGLSWVAVIALAYSLGGWIGAWYWLLPAAGFALGIASLADVAVAHFAKGEGERLPAAAAALVAGALLAVQASHSPIFREYSEWERASRAARAFEERLSASVDEAPDGARVVAPALPMWIQGPPGDLAGVPRVRSAAVFSDYSIQAFADLRWPERRVRVLGIEGGVLELGPAQPSADEVVIALETIAPGF